LGRTIIPGSLLGAADKVSMFILLLVT